MSHGHIGGGRHTCLDHRSKFARKDALPCALVLAGGEGKRLRPFVHLLRGDLLPKQYVNFIGRRSMLEHTLGRAERLVPAERVFTIINKSHLAFPDVRRQLQNRGPGAVIMQPENKETGPGILLALLHIAKRHPNASVTILPSDHFILEEEELLRHLSFAQLLVRREPSRVVLLGIEPDREESEYGYIVPGDRLKRGANPLFEIRSFVEKPDYESAQELTRNGALWNTMMMVLKARVMLEAMSELSPALFDIFRCVDDAIGTAYEKAVVEAAYRDLPPINFSKEILEPMTRDQASRLVTFTVRNVLWSDWGSESRVMDVLRKTGYASRLNGLTKTPVLPSEGVARFEPHAKLTQGRKNQNVKQSALSLAARSSL
ncbi:MAG TPA: sugar phosphate nucleotidyltransferase [Candidatus Binatia bacterium]|jgi:mannose-1-phosphate guanylyltransferase